MKRIIFLVLAILLFSCKDKGGEPCQVPPPDFSMWVNKTSEVHKEFINERGNFDSTHIALYKLIGDTYLHIGTQLWFENDVYTGKTETLYLQNATKTYKIEVNGYMKDTDCGLVPITNEIYVDGVKVENHYLAK